MLASRFTCATVSLLVSMLALAAAPAGEPKEPPKTGAKPEPVYDGKALSEWFTLLRSDDQDQREKAATAITRLAQDGDSIALDLLRAAINDERIVNESALHALVTLGPVAVPVLTQAMWDDKPVVRGVAVHVLGRIGADARTATPVLVHALRDEFAATRALAATALSRARAHAAVPDLLALLDDRTPSVRSAAVEALISLGADAKVLIPALTKDLTDKDIEVRGAATRLLALLGPEAAPAVPDLLKGAGDDWSRYEVLEAIGPAAKDGAPALKTFAADNTAFRAKAAVALWVIGHHKEAVELLETHLKEGTVFDRWYAAVALWQINQNPAAIDALAELVKTGRPGAVSAAARSLGQIGAAAKPAVANLITALDHKELGVRITAALALAHIGPPARDALPALTIAAKDAQEPLQTVAVMAVCRIDPSPATVAALAERLKGKDDSLRRAAAESLGEIGKAARQAVPALKAALTDPRGNVCHAAALALWKIDRSPDSLPALIGLLGSADPAVREQTALTIGYEFGPEAPTAVPALMKQLWDKNSGVRSNAAEALSRIGPDAKGAAPALVALLAADEPDFVQSAACEALGLMGPIAKDAAVTVLKRKLTHPDKYVRVHAALALWHIATDRTGEKELEAGLGNRSYRVRITAAEALWYMNKDKRALPLLLRSVTDSNLLDDADRDNEIYMAVRALGRVGPAAKLAVPALVRRLTHYEPLMARTASEALKVIDPDAAKKAGVK